MLLVGDETQLDVKPVQTLREQYHQVEWTYNKMPLKYPAPPAMQPCVEIRRKKRHSVPSNQCRRIGARYQSDVWPARICTDGDKPVDLYQKRTFGSCLSAIRARALWPTQGNYIAKGATRYSQSRLFNDGTRPFLTHTIGILGFAIQLVF